MELQPFSTDNFLYGEETNFSKSTDSNESDSDNWLSNDIAAFNQYNDALDSNGGESSLEDSDDDWNRNSIDNTEQTDMDYDRF